MTTKEALSILKNFHVTSPWADRRSLIANWKWRDGVDLSYFEKAYIYYYSALDEGFERAKPITKPITSFVINNLRPETAYFVCLRILRRRRLPTRIENLPSSVHSHQTVSTPTNVSEFDVNLLKRKLRQAVQPWQQRYPPTMKTAENYEFEVKCCEAATQNWHLSALVGGLLGVAFAIILGLLLLFVIKRKKMWLTSKSPTHGTLFNRNFICNYNRKSQAKYRSDSSRKALNNRSNFSRRGNALGGNLKEAEEEDEEDEDAIAEDDEDTEADTGCKSSVRSQTGIYGGSGNTTSSYRPSSISSIDPREDSYSLTQHLPISNQQANKRVSRVTKPEIQNVKRNTDHVKSNSYQEATVNPYMSETVSKKSSFSDIKLKIASPSSDLIDTKEDLHSLGIKTPGDGQTTSDSSENEQTCCSRDSLRRLIQNSERFYQPNLSIVGESNTFSATNKVCLTVNCSKTAVSCEFNFYDKNKSAVLSSPVKALHNAIPSIQLERDYTQVYCEIFPENLGDQSPLPLGVPQPVNLQTPVVFSPNEQLNKTSSTNFVNSMIESPKVNELQIAQAHNDDSVHISGDNSPSSFSISSTLSLSSTYPYNSDAAIEVNGSDFVEFVETI